MQNRLSELSDEAHNIFEKHRVGGSDRLIEALMQNHHQQAEILKELRVMLKPRRRKRSVLE